MQQRIGFYAGTFDPVHQGHISFALEAKRICQLERLVFMPEASPRNKPNASAIGQRIDLLSLAIKPYDDMDVLSPSQEHFSVKQTLPELQQLFPDSQLVMLIGSDVALHSLKLWDGLAELLKSVSLVIGIRAQDDPQTIMLAINQLQVALHLPIDYICISTPHANLSSTSLRQQRPEQHLLR